MKPKERESRRWPGGFWTGDPIVYKGHRGYVISVPNEVTIPRGYVPILIEEKGTILPPAVPADDLDYPKPPNIAKE